jgi:gluconolactonase
MMRRLLPAFAFAFAVAASLQAQSPTATPSATTNAAPSKPAPPPPLPPVVKLSADELVKKMQAAVLMPTAANPPEGFQQPGIPHGEYVNITVSGSKIYPGTTNTYGVYIPGQYDPAKPACLLVSLDGFNGFQANVLDNLIARGEMPVMIAIGIPSLVVNDQPRPDAKPGDKPKVLRYDRGYEFDSVNDHFPDYVINEVLSQLPKLKTKDGRPVIISPNASDHMAMGGSSGGIGAFTLAWRRPDVFGRVYTTIGTYVSMRGGHEYPYLIRKTDPKPLRIFLEDGEADAWNPLFGSWYEANVLMNSAFTFAGYDEAHAWGKHGHGGAYSNAIFPDAMRWMWRDYPALIKAGVSQNSTLMAVTIPNEGWQSVDGHLNGACGLAANAKGEVYFCDGPNIFHLGDDGKLNTIAPETNRIAAQAFGPDGTFYWIEPEAKQIIARAPDGTRRVVAEGIAGHGLTVTHDGTAYVSEPGQHSDMPSQVWQIKPDGTKTIIDQGLSSASGVAFSPDGQIFYAAEASTKWVYTYIVQPDGTFADKQSFFWLHMTDIPNNSGAEDMCCDALGNLYVATRMGIQIGDQNGRVRAILPLPTPTGAARSLCFGGPKFDVLYATDGTHIFKRQMKVPGVPPWSPPVNVPSIGGG